MAGPRKVGDGLTSTEYPVSKQRYWSIVCLRLQAAVAPAPWWYNEIIIVAAASYEDFFDSPIIGKRTSDNNDTKATKTNW